MCFVGTLLAPKARHPEGGEPGLLTWESAEADPGATVANPPARFASSAACGSASLHPGEGVAERQEQEEVEPAGADADGVREAHEERRTEDRRDGQG